MTKLDLTAIFLSKKNLSLAYNLHDMCKKFNINLLYCMDFVDLTIKSIQLKPQLVFCDCSTMEFNSGNLNAFMEKNEFKSTKIIFIGEKEQTKLIADLHGENIVVANSCDVFGIVEDMQGELHYQKYRKDLNNNPIQNLDLHLYKMLSSLGFSEKHSGCAYLRASIKEIVKCNGVVPTLVTDLYPLIAALYRTNVSNIERNMRQAIDHAWNIYGKNNWYKTFFSKSLELGKRPTNREFISMCAETVLSQIAQNIEPIY